MSEPIATRLQEIADALSTVDGARYYSDPAAALDPPALVTGLPSMTWESYCDDGQPDSLTLLVYVVVAADDRAEATLWTLVPLVVQALNGVANVVVTTATPGSYQASGTELPCYEISVEVSL